MNILESKVWIGTCSLLGLITICLWTLHISPQLTNLLFPEECLMEAMESIFRSVVSIKMKLMNLFLICLLIAQMIAQKPLFAKISKSEMWENQSKILDLWLKTQRITMLKKKMNES